MYGVLGKLPVESGRLRAIVAHQEGTGWDEDHLAAALVNSNVRLAVHE